MPTYQDARNGVALSVAMAEAAVIARIDVAFLNTFEFRHPLVDTIRLVCDNQDLVATLEGNAPEDAGQSVTFTAFQLTKTRPEESDTADSPSMTLTASGVSGLLAQAFRTTRGSLVPWEITERVYASDDTTGPAIIPVNTLLIATSQITATVASIVANFGDPANVAVPRLTFKPGGST